MFYFSFFTLIYPCLEYGRTASVSAVIANKLGKSEEIELREPLIDRLSALS